MSFRAVLDTNVILAGHLSQSSTSPAREIIQRWKLKELQLLYAEDILMEYSEKFVEKNVSPDVAHAFLVLLRMAAECIELKTYHERTYAADPDDIPFQFCAINGNASHLVTYDSDFDPIREQFAFRVCNPVEFLTDLRAALS